MAGSEYVSMCKTDPRNGSMGTAREPRCWKRQVIVSNTSSRLLACCGRGRRVRGGNSDRKCGEIFRPGVPKVGKSACYIEGVYIHHRACMQAQSICSTIRRKLNANDWGNGIDLHCHSPRLAAKTTFTQYRLAAVE